MDLMAVQLKPGDILLGIPGSEISLTSAGRKLSEFDNEIIRERRAVDGTLTSDIVAVKKLFSVTYELIQGTNLEAIVTLYNLHSDLSLILCDRDGSTRSYTVRLRPLRRDRITVLGDWIWSGVVLELEEI